MLNINEIIEEYRNGDFDTRLSFFMEYRDIREEFIRIDEKETAHTQKKKTTKTFRPFFNALCGN